MSICTSSDDCSGGSTLEERRKGGRKGGIEVRDIREGISRKGAKRWGKRGKFKEVNSRSGRGGQQVHVGENDGIEGREKRQYVTRG